jgi:signal transduction histidine kinase
MGRQTRSIPALRPQAERTRTRLLEQLISAEDQERRRIARELHDETGQSLTAILVGLRALTEMPLSQDARAVVARLREVAAQTAEDVTRLARGLHPAVLDEKGLAHAAHGYVGDYVRTFGIAVDFVAGDLDSPTLAPMIAATMYRLLQEALTNVARHSGARRVKAELKRYDSMIELRVRDNGAGFDVRSARARSTLGLRGMAERVTLLGGSLELDSRAGRGTVLRARVPTTTVPPARAQRRRS